MASFPPLGTVSLLSSTLVLFAACDPDHGDEPCLAVGDTDWRTGRNSEMQGCQMQGTQWRSLHAQGCQEQGASSQGVDGHGHALAASALTGVELELADGSPVTLRDGRLTAAAHDDTAALRDVELRATSREGQQFSLTIASVTEVDGSERIEIVAGGAHVCAPGKAGMFLAGRWDDIGAHSRSGDELTYACMDGVIAKCVAWGYAPWRVGAEVHQTCTRLARADYCGDGHPWTLNGTTIDVYDTLGVQTPVRDPGLSFEAAWGKDGAVCVNATRYDVTNGDGDTILPDCFAALPRCTSLAEAAEHGAQLANDSAHTLIEACR